jgi:hypothetical protein
MLGCARAMLTETSHQTINTVRLEWPPADERSRKVVRRSNIRATGKFPSFRNAKSLHYESLIERDCFRILDIDTTITSFSEQPVVIHYTRDGNERTHYPDILTIGNGRKTFLEVKDVKSPDLDDAIDRANYLTPFLMQLGYRYEVITSDVIQSEPRLSNAKTLLRHGRNPVDAFTKESLRRYFGSDAQTTWHHVLAGQLGKFGTAYVARLILEGMLTFDKSKLLGPTTLIQLTANERGN